MSQKIVRRKTDGEQISCRARAQFFVGDQGAGKFQLIVIGKGRGANHAEEFGAGFAGGAEQHVAAAILDFFAPVLVCRTALVELLHPGGQLVAVVAGGDPGAALLIYPVSAIAGPACGEDRSTVLERNSEYTRFALSSQLEFVAQSAGQQVVRRSAGAGGAYEV